MAFIEKDIETVEQRLREYLAGCFGLTAEHRAEIGARLRGFRDVRSQKRYELLSQQFFVLELSFEDVTADGLVNVSETFRRMPWLETKSYDEAKAFAESKAAERQHPMVVTNAAFELLEVVDEPIQPSGPYAVHAALGAILDFDAPLRDGSVAEDFDLVDAHLRQKRLAVAVALKYLEDKCKTHPPDETTEHTVFVTVEASGEIFWRARR